MTEERRWAQAIIETGDEAAFRRLYRRHTPKLYQFALRLLGGRVMDAEDVVQESWVRAVSNLSGFRWQASFSTWLIGIGLNLCREKLRRETRRRNTRLEAIPTLRCSGEPGARLDLEKAVALLPQGYRMALLLHDLEGWTHREIAQRLGITEGTSKSQLYNARKILRSYLRQDREIRNERPQRRRQE